MPLPDNVARDAEEVRAAVGVSRQQRPREAIARLVQYFRGFADSDDPPHGRGNVYLDLALSKKGVCRHRAFAFLITAQSLGLPTRMVLNEAHAWVEVHDGVLWRRIDLGGAGHMANPASSALPERAAYRPPPDSFAWPQNAERGDDMVTDARARAGMPGADGAAAASNATGSNGDADAPSASTARSAADAGSASAAPSAGSQPSSSVGGDERPASVVTLAVGDPNAHRGAPMHVRGGVDAEGEACPRVAVEIRLREACTPGARGCAGASRMVLLGTVATGEDGRFTGGVVVPGSTPLGDYDVVARTPGDARCGQGASN